MVPALRKLSFSKIEINELCKRLAQYIYFRIVCVKSVSLSFFVATYKNWKFNFVMKTEVLIEIIISLC